MEITTTPPESYVTPRIRELFKPQFATQDRDVDAMVLKTWQDFAQGLFRRPNAPGRSPDMVATIGFFGL